MGSIISAIWNGIQSWLKLTAQQQLLVVLVIAICFFGYLFYTSDIRDKNRSEKNEKKIENNEIRITQIEKEHKKEVDSLNRVIQAQERNYSAKIDSINKKEIQDLKLRVQEAEGTSKRVNKVENNVNVAIKERVNPLDK